MILHFTIKIDNNFYQLYRKKEWWYKIKAWEKITVEKHLNDDIKISKNWIYIDHKISHDRPQRVFKLLTAPVSNFNLDLMKENMLNQEYQGNILKQIQKQNNNNEKISYFSKHWKSSPFIANCFN